MNVRISAKDYRGYVERGEGIPALMPKANPPKGGKAAAKKAESKRTGKYNAAGQFVDRRTGLPVDKGAPNAVYMASAAQAVRYRQLVVLRDLGVISDLKIEVPFILAFNGVHICNYRADAVYTVCDTDVAGPYQVIEDVKGMVLPEYKIKKKLMAANATPISEIPAKDVSSWLLRIPPPPA
jgi:hypothetical protein